MERIDLLNPVIYYVRSESMRTNKIIPAIGLVSALALAPIATSNAAPEKGFYLGGAWGAYQITEGSLDDNDDLLRVFGGVQITEWFGVEAQWADFNRQSNNNGERFEADGAGVAAVFSLPIGDRSAFFGKIGNFWWKSDANFGGQVRSGDGDDVFGGAGFLLGFNRHVGLRLEWERYDVNKADVDTFSAGVQFTF
jgi:hypothetical protein